MKRIFCFLLLLMTSFVSLYAQETENNPAIVDIETMISDNPCFFLGFEPKDIIEKFGPPTKVYSVRGYEEWQDDVVFDYSKGYSFFFFSDRVWQIKIDNTWRETVLGLELGSDIETISTVFGTPSYEMDSAYEWEIPGESWPVTMRVNFYSGKAMEIYIYRGDF